MKIEQIEHRFKEVAGLEHLDLSVLHFERGDGQQQKTTKEECKKYGFVCTPLWLVDEMLEPEIANLKLTSTTCDACSGCGQFSVRLMRKFYYRLIQLGAPENIAERFIVERWLPKNHYFTEFQFSNVAKIVYIFGTGINVYAGDTLNMKFSRENESGILFFNPNSRRWVNIPGLISTIEPMKDDLGRLLRLFAALEKKIKSEHQKHKVSCFW